MKIRALRLTNHRPVAVTTPYGSSTSIADIMRHIRKVEAEALNRSRRGKSPTKRDQGTSGTT